MPVPLRSRFLAMLLLVVLLATGLPAGPAVANSSMEADFVSRINSERTSRGLRALTVAGDMVSVARTHSRRMADADHLHHNPNFGTEVKNWRKVGENVGRGPSVSSLHKAFMDSPSHRKNVLDPDWTEVGVGVVVVDGRIWVTQLFRLPAGASAPAPEPAAAAPTPEPEPAPEPAPAPAPAPAPSPSPAPAPAPSPAPAPAPAPAPTPASPVPHEVTERPEHLDRFTVTLARLERAEVASSPFARD